MKAAILLVSSHATIVLLGADQQYLEENEYTTYKVFFIRGLLFECTFCNLHFLLNIEYLVFFKQKHEMQSSMSSERTGTDFSAVKHQSHQPSSSI